MFWLGWKQGSATVVARRHLKLSVHDGVTARKSEYLLDVTPNDGSPPFRGTCITWKSADKGQVIRVKFRPKSKKIKFRLELPKRQRPQPRDERWNKMVEGEPGSNMGDG